MKLLRRLAAGVAVVVVVTIVAFWVSPRPGSMLIRFVFERGGAATAERMAERVPDGVGGEQDLSYGSGNDEVLDIWRPEDRAGEVLPVVVWVHGGGWVAGSKEDVAPYLQILASHGYAVVGLDYSLAPGSQYPTPVEQTDRALAWLNANAGDHDLDMTRLVLAGDSAGAHIAAQYAALVTSSDYADEVGVRPVLDPAALRGVVLNCGPFVPAMVDDAGGAGGWFVRTVAWAYIGTKDFGAPIMDEVDLVQHATAQFPATWISGGNNDPLTPQGEAFAQHLDGLGVAVSPLFFADDHEPALGHEYQFDLDLDAAQQALAGTVEFLAEHLG